MIRCRFLQSIPIPNAMVAIKILTIPRTIAKHRDVAACQTLKTDDLLWADPYNDIKIKHRPSPPT